MTTKKNRKRIVMGCLVATVLPFCARASSETVIHSGSGELRLYPARPVTPWFRETFILFRADATLATNTLVLPNETAAMPQLTRSAPQLPGTVESLRRTDRR